MSNEDLYPRTIITDRLPPAGRPQAVHAGSPGSGVLIPCPQDSAFQTQFLHPCWANFVLCNAKRRLLEKPNLSIYLFFLIHIS